MRLMQRCPAELEPLKGANILERSARQVILRGTGMHKICPFMLHFQVPRVCLLRGITASHLMSLAFLPFHIRAKPADHESIQITWQTVMESAQNSRQTASMTYNYMADSHGTNTPDTGI